MGRILLEKVLSALALCVLSTFVGADLQADVVVVGGGGAGTAAVSAAENGASILIEAPFLGGNTIIAGEL